MLIKELINVEKLGVKEGSEQSLQKKIQAKRDALGLAREQRRMRGQHQQGPREIKLQAEIDRLSTELQQQKQGVAEGSLAEDAYQEDAIEIIEEISEHLMEARSASRLLNHRYDDGWLDDKVSSLHAHIAQAITMCEHIHAHMTDTGEE